MPYHMSRFLSNRLKPLKSWVALALLAACGGGATAQTVVYDSFPVVPCPDVKINEKYDHVGSPAYSSRGWDTAVTYTTRELTLTSEPYIPVQYFNGKYTVTQIPYNPPDTTFYLNYNTATDANNPLKQKLDIHSDDAWAPGYVNIAFPFFFFGVQKNKFLLGDNGIVTFATPTGYNGGGGCSYATITAIPWPTSVPTATSASGSLPSPALMRDAIYGVYEDTYTGVNGSYMSGNQGIYYGVLDNYPCRKIIASWYQIPIYSNQNKRQTYQMVCYEGSNIIEIHIKKREYGKTGLIGIQNATGTAQVRGEIGTSTYYVGQNTDGDVGSTAAAYAVPGWNPISSSNTTTYENIAYRFTPHGKTFKTATWYRIFDDGRDSVVLTEAMGDTNGYIIPMNNSNTSHPTLTKAIVRPKCVSRYVLQLMFKNALGQPYILYDTITIGVDTTNTLSLTYVPTPTDPNPTPASSRTRAICNGQSMQMRMSYPSTQTASRVDWTVERMLYGRRITLPESMYSINDNVITVTSDPRYDTLPANHIDSIRVQVSVDFINGSTNYDTFMVRVFPRFDTIIEEGICRGETFHWTANNHDYTEATTTPYAILKSAPGCDSVVRLHLTVYDVQQWVEAISDCKPYRWRNGKIYKEDNTTTAATDTVVLHNRFGCDSIIQLNFTIHPLTARLQSDVKEFTLDNLDAVLTDISTGSNGRTWRLPSLDENGDSISREEHDALVYYTIPAEMDGATIWIIATSEYGCEDSTSIYLPLHKEHFWIPNAFLPESDDNNLNQFGSVSTQTTLEEMFIYNRLGQLVHHSSGIDSRWDGRDLNGNPCPQGAYTYVIRYTNVFTPGVTQTLRGTVTLIR